MRNFINTITIGRVFGIRQDRTNVVTGGDKAWASSLSRYLSVRHVRALAAMHLHREAAAAAMHLERLRLWMQPSCLQPVRVSPCGSSKPSALLATS